jgi:tRNA A-37 threonylcarbamoyl transferase component Bud32
MLVRSMPRCRCCGKDWPTGLAVCPEGGDAFDDEPTEIVVAPTTPREALALEDVVSRETELVVPSRDLAAGTVVGEFQIVRKVGQGAMGTVYEAAHPLIGKKAAVKVLSSQLGASPQFLARFVREARAIARIGHPNIVDAYSFGTLPDGRCYFVMEWLQGKTLGERLQEGRLTLADSLDILDQMCRGLAAAHEKGIVHRDLKPDNVFLTDVRGERPRVKLLDFSIAKVDRDEAAEQPDRTQTGVLLGTPLYVSPEQAKGRGVDHRTDLYSLGVVAYEVVLGKLPFASESSVEVLSMHLHQPPPRPVDAWPGIPPSLERLILGLLAKEAEARPSLAEARRTIEELQQLEPSAAPIGTGTVLAGHGLDPASVRRAIVAGAAVILVLSLALAWYAARAPEIGPAPRPEPAAPAPMPPPVAAPLVEASGSIIVKVDALDARIEVDGRVVAESADTATVHVNPPGRHTVFVTAPGRVAFQRIVTVGAGATVEVAVRLDPDPEVAPPPPRPKPKPRVPSLGGDGTVDPFKLPPRSP